MRIPRSRFIARTRGLFIQRAAGLIFASTIIPVAVRTAAANKAAESTAVVSMVVVSMVAANKVAVSTAVASTEVVNRAAANTVVASMAAVTSSKYRPLS